MVRTLVPTRGRPWTWRHAANIRDNAFISTLPRKVRDALALPQRTRLAC